MNIGYNLKIVIIMLLTLMLCYLIAAGFLYKILTSSFAVYNKKFDILNEKIGQILEKIGKVKKNK